MEIIQKLGSKINQKFIFQGSRLNGEKSFKIFQKSLGRSPGRDFF